MVSENEATLKHWAAQDILETLNARRDELRRMGARQIGLFGSYRRGTPTPTSDMDFLVTLARPSFDDYMSIKFFLEDLFGCNIDLVLEDGLKPRLRSWILGEVLYAGETTDSTLKIPLKLHNAL